MVQQRTGFVLVSDVLPCAAYPLRSLASRCVLNNRGEISIDQQYASLRGGRIRPRLIDLQIVADLESFAAAGEQALNPLCGEL